MSNLIIKRAITSEELNKAYHVRFKTLTELMGDTRYANFEKQIYTDPQDSGNVRVYIATLGGIVVGTVRLSVRKEYGQPFTAEWFYDFPRLAKELGWTLEELLEAIALIERGGVLKQYQSKGIWKDLLAYAIHDLLGSGSKIIIGAIDTKNTSSIKAFEEAGWKIDSEKRPYKDNWYHLIRLNIM